MDNLNKPPPARILVVEDDSVTRKAVCLSIAADPALQLAEAFDCMAPALIWLQQQRPDVLLVDLGLPDGSGIDIIRLCAERHPECNIMVLTTSSDQSDVLDSIEAGATGYLLKGSYKDEISRAILALREGEAPMSPGIARLVLQRLREGRHAADRDNGSVASLTRREQTILDLIATGASYGDIALQLSLSVSTVQTHIKNIYGKLSVHSRSAAVFEARRQGLLSKR